ncbi:hypothetical protein JG688_00010357 [Phytophthora aleatoria]|uniref:Uncharacterized protein n=1 Tax=Phytophthora aleatoria TaxID=2496075 RepID=A0A8J5J538_9STRA|nr:hypothetical protein JG688_00010357 [Phytophthora aleatoria]
MYSSKPVVSPRTPMTAITTYGGCTQNGVPCTPGFGFSNSVFQPLDWTEITRQQRVLQRQLKNMKLNEEPQTPVTSAATLGGVPTPMRHEPKFDGYAYGMPSSEKNAARMIQPSYSDKSTVGKDQSFWNGFERATTGLNEAVRLRAFR